jgi:gamma-glutamylcyclotransferase (GGCT)/AIG2-like uncharacterized protein YtfP
MGKPLFAYGTLRQGAAPGEIAAAVARMKALGSGVARGRVFDLGAYPGAVFDSDGEVRGEVYAVASDADWAAMDAYEGAQYRRREIEVKTAGGDLVCWAYEYLGGRP